MLPAKPIGNGGGTNPPSHFQISDACSAGTHLRDVFRRFAFVTCLLEILLQKKINSSFPTVDCPSILTVCSMIDVSKCRSASHLCGTGGDGKQSTSARGNESGIYSKALLASAKLLPKKMEVGLSFYRAHSVGLAVPPELLIMNMQWPHIPENRFVGPLPCVERLVR